MGPRLGCPMNITAFGNDDRLDVGIALDPAALTQPDLLIECLTDAFHSFVTASGIGAEAGVHDEAATTPARGTRRDRTPALQG
jgi:hypothetical protein